MEKDMIEKYLDHTVLTTSSHIHHHEHYVVFNKRRGGKILIDYSVVSFTTYVR